MLMGAPGMIRMPDTIRDADGSARNDKPSLSMAQSSTKVLVCENDSHSQERGGKIDQGPRYAAGRTLDTKPAGS